ncbi:MAG: rhomboid family intramembrane serine protease [Clostridia bacterium]|nr:rhomboid family intramembrane serine protease [Clostridia bacterium]
MNRNPVNFDLERRMRRYAIANLMKYIAIGQGIVFLLLYIWPSLGAQLYSLINLNRYQLLRGQIWRLVTFVFVPPSTSPLFIIFALYFYYMIGLGLEHRWGKVRLNLYYLVGMIGAWITCFLTGYADNTFLNLSLFFGYAALYPNEEVLFMMFLPVKMKYLALLDAAIYIYYFIVGGASTRISIILCLINVFLFLGGDLLYTIRRESQYWKTRYNFRKTMKNNRYR